MPNRTSKPCPKCGKAIGYKAKACASCLPAVEMDRKRQYRNYNATERDPIVVKWLNSKQYRTMRLHFIRTNPMCRMCSDKGISTPSVILDHITPHNGDAALFWDTSNWQPLCVTCHGEKRKDER